MQTLHHGTRFSLSINQIRHRVHSPSTGIRKWPEIGSRRLQTEVAAIPGDGSSYVEKDLASAVQLASIKKAADDVMTSLQAKWDSKGVKGSGGGEGEQDPGSQELSADVQRLRTKIQYAVEVMQEGLVERDTEVRLLLLAALSREHILFIGPPGTAKSEIGRRLSKLIQGTYFERLLTRFSVPEELFGPLSMRALEEDKYVRQTRGYLPEAQVAFIDEIFKANSAILNTLLTVLNERLFDNGSTRTKVPLVTMVGASNELPESEELDALYDRFLLRRSVSQVSSGGLGQLLEYYAGNEEDVASDNGTDSSSTTSSSSSSVQATMDTIDPTMMLTPQDFAHTREAAIKSVRVPRQVIQLLGDLRTFLQEKQEPPVYVSDRRLVKAVALMQVAAYCNGRSTVTEYDCLLLQHVLWQTPDQVDRIADWVLGQLAVDDGNKQVQYLLSGIFGRACKSLGHKNTDDIQEEVKQLRMLLVERLEHVVLSLGGGFASVQDNLWLPKEEGDAVATALVPKLQRTQESVRTLLSEVVTLEVALKANCDAVTLACLMPQHWAAFIRNSPMDEVKPLGTTPLSGGSTFRRMSK